MQVGAGESYSSLSMPVGPLWGLRTGASSAALIMANHSDGEKALTGGSVSTLRQIPTLPRGSCGHHGKAREAEGFGGIGAVADAGHLDPAALNVAGRRIGEHDPSSVARIE